MRIAHITDCYLPRLGGIEMQVHDLARRQIAAGHDVQVITATPRARHDRTAEEVVDGVPVRRVTVDLPFELPVHPRPGRAVGRLAQGAGWDAVQVHVGVVSPFAAGALPALVAARVPTVVTVHSLWGYAAPGFRLADLLTGWSRWPVALSAVSQVAAAPVRRIAGPGVAVDVLPNGIDPAPWQVTPVDRDPDDVLVAAVMRLAPRKRPMPLLRVLREARDLLPDDVRLRVTIVGEGPQRRAMERYLDRHAMTGWVELPGRWDRDRIRELYRRADLYVSPAILESFGIAALEARCAGLPVLARADSGVREFVADGVEGSLASSDGELTAALVRLATSPGLRRRIADHNRSVPPAVTWDDVLARTEQAYARAATLTRAAR